MMPYSSLRAAGSMLLVTALLSGCDSTEEALNTSAAETVVSPTEGRDVVAHYADIALATYEDALTTAKVLKEASLQLVDNPSEETLELARAAWIAARVPYQQSEVFRFGNPVVDDWEGQLNAWPLDEGLIDYVQPTQYDYEMGNDGALANIVSNTELTVNGEKLDLNTLTPQLLADLNELGGSEANVATGYHAVEFLLWGTGSEWYCSRCW